MTNDKSDFTQGSILKKLVAFMIPVLGALILQAAYGYEQCTHHRTPPVLKPVSSEVMQRTD